jgi:hypothetical protein
MNTPSRNTHQNRKKKTMLTLILLAAAVLSPAAVLAIAGPGETPLMTKPKNLGVFGAEIVNRPRLVAVPVIDLATDDRDEILADVSLKAHASHIPAGLRVGADA